MSKDDWSGRKVTQARAALAARTAWPVHCARGCGTKLHVHDAWRLGHIKDRWSHPELTWDPTNWQVECRKCSDSSGPQASRDKAVNAALKAAGVTSSPSTPPSQSPPLPVHTHKAPAKPLEVRSELEWANHVQSPPTWLLPLLVVPQDASPPLAMTPVHPDAVDSYGWDAIVWAEQELGVKLRWWQQLAVVRQLEHRADGTLCWRNVIESCPRRAGKSVRLRVLALWRQANAHLFHEPQLQMMCGKDLSIAREIHRKAWRWAQERDGWTVRKGVGQEEVSSEDETHRWLVRSLDGIYGFDVSAASVDEAWAVPPAVVTEGLEPAMLERVSPQLLLTSTAHRKATSLMRTRISAALAQDDGETLLLYWGARPQDDPAAESTWKDASPHWSEDRRKMIRSKYDAAQSGQTDQELDDPDPVEGFAAQYLNIWKLNERREAKGDPLISAEAWDELTDAVPATAPDTVAVEAWFADGVSVALAWKTEGAPIVRVIDHQDLAGACDTITASGFRGFVQIGSSLATDPALRGLKLRPVNARTTASVADLARLLAENGIRHDGSELLREQVLGIRTQPGADGPRLISKGRADALKAAVWAASAARKPGLGGIRLVGPRPLSA